MSRTTTRRATAHSPSQSSPRYGRTTALAVGGLMLVVLVALTVSSPEDPPAQPAFVGTGMVSLGGVQVDGAEIAMGDVPLGVEVVPTWTLTNTGSEAVALGQPHASVLEGCCPGPLLLSDSQLSPGESAELAFPLEMHAGMDGPHDFDIHVPVLGTNGYLTLGVTGDFRG